MVAINGIWSKPLEVDSEAAEHLWSAIHTEHEGVDPFKTFRERTLDFIAKSRRIVFLQNKKVSLALEKELIEKELKELEAAVSSLRGMTTVAADETPNSGVSNPLSKRRSGPPPVPMDVATLSADVFLNVLDDVVATNKIRGVGWDWRIAAKAFGHLAEMKDIVRDHLYALFSSPPGFSPMTWRPETPLQSSAVAARRAEPEEQA